MTQHDLLWHITTW